MRGAGNGREFLAIRPRGLARWQLPKGIVDRGETVREAAVREVREEAGVEADVVVPLESVHYFYQSRGQRVAKTVDFFLMTYRRGDPADHDEEVDEVRWFPLGEADVLAFPSERTVVERAAGLLSESVGG